MTPLEKELEEFEKEFAFRSSAIGDPAMEYVNSPNIIQDTKPLTDFLRTSLLRFTESVINEAMPEKQMSHIPNDFDNGWNDCRTQLKQNLEKILHNQKEV